MAKYNTVKNYADFVYDKLTRRGKAVVKTIESKGYFVKYDLERYNIAPDQGPRAVRDCREQGIPIKVLNRTRVKESVNPVSRYTFGRVEDIGNNAKEGMKLEITWSPKEAEQYKALMELSKQTGAKAENIAKSVLKDLLF